MITLKKEDLTPELKNADNMLRNNLKIFMNKLTKIAQKITDLLQIEDEKTKARVYCEVITFLTNAACTEMQYLNSIGTMKIEEELQLDDRVENV